MLFSEPKIPQCCEKLRRAAQPRRFSALQRAENSSMFPPRTDRAAPQVVSVLFSEPKIPQYEAVRSRVAGLTRFSALQRAENSSIQHRRRRDLRCVGFSALQRAENSSIVLSSVQP